MKTYVIRIYDKDNNLSDLFRLFSDRLENCSYTQTKLSGNNSAIWFKAPMFEDDKIYLILRYNECEFYNDDYNQITTEFFSPCV
jgi:hypothetical protein